VNDAARAAAFAALEDAITKIAALPCDCHAIPVDAVLLIGMQYIDDDGDRSGYVNIVARNGWQPAYITAGLLEMAKVSVLDMARPPDDE
jgi:hypothetical protein